MRLALSLQNVLVLLTIQFAIFGWRINREITVGDQARRTWFPIPDFVNVASMICVLFFCVLQPLMTEGSAAPVAAADLPPNARGVFAAGLVLAVMHPISMIAHYGLLNEHGRESFEKTEEGDYPPFPLQEQVVVVIALTFALKAFCFVART